ncbi:MAG: bifunctional diguanylate cyclase/phosphodiesterase [Acidiferrobacteraceae bacterium]
MPPFNPRLAQKLEFLLNLSNDAILVLDEQGRIVVANDVAGRIFGCSRNDLNGVVFRSLRTPESIKPLPYETRPENLIYEAWFRRRADAQFLADVSLSTIIEDGEKFYVSVLRDITPREESLRQQQLASAVFDNSTQGIAITDAKNRILAVNPAFERLTGYSASELIGRTPNILKSGLQDRTFYAAMWYSITIDGRWEGEIWNRHKSGEMLPEWLTISVVRDGAGKIAHYIAICSDISERKQAERKLQRLADLYSALSEIDQLIAHRLDQDSLFSEICRIAVDYGHLKLAWIGFLDEKTRQVVPTAVHGEGKEHVEKLRVPIDSDVPGGRAVVSMAFRSGSCIVSNDYLGDPSMDYWRGFIKLLGLQAVAAFPIRRAGTVVGILTVYSEDKDFFEEDLTLLLQRMADDISFALDSLDQEERRRMTEARISYLASHDTLTCLHRRNALEEVLAREHAEAERHGRSYGLALIDLDHFKVINDSYGHAVGDQVLVAVARVLKETFREMDWVGRWGGEEFLCLLPETDSALALQTMQRLRERIAGTLFPTEEGRSLRVTASIGVVSFPADGQTVADLLVQVDTALYRAKQEGGDRVARVENAPSIFLVGGQIEEALREHRIIPAYQPIVSLSSGDVVADEALARLVVPGRETLEAGCFVESAAHLHQLHRIDQTVIQQAMTRCVTRLRAGAPPRLHFVNASAAFLSHPQLITNLLEDARCHCTELEMPERCVKPIVVEITERAMLSDRQVVLRSLQPLLDFGLRIALDDFGSGYSSFLYLAEFPVSFLKIEQHLVNRVCQDRRIAAMVRSIASLARDLGLTTIAEGIEDAATAEMLGNLGVDWGQGYYFGWPQIE